MPSYQSAAVGMHQNGTHSPDPSALRKRPLRDTIASIIQSIFHGPGEWRPWCGAAFTGHDSNNPERLAGRSVGDQVIAHHNEAQRAVRQIGATKPLLGKTHQAFNRPIDFVHQTERGAGAVLPDISRDVVKVREGFWVKGISVHANLQLPACGGPYGPERSENGELVETKAKISFHAGPRRASMFARKRAKASSPGINFTLPLSISS